MIIIDLIYNLALLAALSVVSGFVSRRWPKGHLGAVLQGLVFGVSAVIGMLRPLVLGPGLFFDGRSVMISLCALFFGPWAAAVAGGMAIICRVVQGGVGAPMGVSVILTSLLLGLVYHFRQRRRGGDWTSLMLFSLGLLVHIVMLSLTAMLPADKALDTLKKIAFPVMLTYPLATVLIGRILCDHRDRGRFVEALRESEERLRLAMTAAEQGFFDLNVRTGEAVVSPEYARMLGYDPDGFVETNEKWRERLHPDDRESVYRAYAEYVAGQRSEYRVEFRQRTRDGDWKWIMSLGKVVERDAEGRPLRMLGTHTDITDRKKAEESLQREELFAKAFLESLPGIFYVYSHPELKLVRWNRNHARLLGYDAGEMNGRSIMSWHPPEAMEAVRQAVPVVMEKGENMMESPLLTKDGRAIPFLLTGVRCEVLGQMFLVGVGIDISERKRVESEHEKLQAQYLQAQKMEAVGRLAGGVAHDLNNMLSPILGYSEMLLETIRDEKDRREALEQIVRAGERARDLVRQLLAFSRKQVMEFKDIDLNKAVGAFEKLLRRTIREDIAIDIIVDPSVPPVRGDIGQIEQVIMNLAVNAQDAMPRGGRLTIETGLADLDGHYVATHPAVATGRYVVLSISDTGHGMDSATRARLFEPFFTTKPVGEGTGLGLATSYGIVKQHGGSIGVYSEPGRGTTFKVYLPAPARQEIEQEVRAVDQSIDPSGGETLLLVEDDAMVRDVARAMLEHSGYKVLLARNGTEALSLLDKEEIAVHLLLTDVVMPEMNGRELYALARERRPELRVLFMSGYTANVIAHDGILDEGLRFIHKPFSPGALAAKVREALDARL